MGHLWSRLQLLDFLRRELLVARGPLDETSDRRSRQCSAKRWFAGGALLMVLTLQANRAVAQTNTSELPASAPTTTAVSTTTEPVSTTTVLPPGQSNGGASVSASPAGDPNWFLSSTAQSAAALVAIVGGFLVSRIISMASERSGLSSRCDELREQLNAHNRALVDTTTERRSYTDRWFRRVVADKIVSALGEINPETIALENQRYGAELDEHIEVATELAEAVREAAAAIRRLDEGGKPTGSVSDLENELGPFSERQADLYRKVLAEVHPIPRGGSRSLLGFTPTQLGPLPDLTRGDRERETVEQLVREERRLRAECEAFKGQLELTEGLLARVRQPEGVKGGFGVLAFFALTGVVPPILLMATEPTEVSAGMRALLLVLFLVGLGSLLGYVYWAIKRLVRAD